MDAGLTQETILVTGASGGIGGAIASALQAEGAFVGLHGFRRRADHLAGERGVVLTADLRDERQVDAMLADLIAVRGRVDAVVVNAGVWVAAPAPIHTMTLAQWQETLATDLTSAFLTCRAFFRHLEQAPRQDASVVLVGSTAGLFGEADHADYAAAKAGLVHGLLLSAKNEIVRLAPRGRVNAVCPGWVATGMVESTLARRDAMARATATMALDKIATVEDVARAVVFLTSSHLAGHVTGAVFPVTGGMEGRRLR